MSYITLPASTNSVPTASGFQTSLRLSTSALTRNRFITLSLDDADYTLTLSGGGLNVAAIGNVTPGTGAFTTLSGTGNATWTKSRPELILTHTGAAASAHLLSLSSNTVYLTNNLSNNGTNWLLDDTSVMGGVLTAYAGNLEWYTAPAAANPATLTVRLSVTTTGINSTAIGATTPNTGAFTTLSSSGGFWVQGGGTPAAGSGLEAGWSGSVVYVQGYNRTGAAWLNMQYGGLSHVIQVSGSTVATVNSSGLTMAKDIAVTNASTNSSVIIDCPNTFASQLILKDAGTIKWYVGKGSGSGNNNYTIYDNAGAVFALDITTGTGAIRIGGYGAGSLTTDASGNITAVSDERVKRNIRPFRTGLAAALALRPILHGYSPDSGLDQTRDDYAGFSAQNVQVNIPEAVAVSKDGMLSLSHAPILATLTNAIQELHEDVTTEVKALKQQIASLQARLDTIS